MKIQQNETRSYKGAAGKNQSFKKFIYKKDVDSILLALDTKIKAVQGETKFLSSYTPEKEKNLVKSFKKVSGFVIAKSKYKFPKNPARVLWANLKELLSLKHAENKNDIVVDTFSDKGKKFIEISVFDSKKNKLHEEVVEAAVERNTMRNLFPVQDHDFSAREYTVSRVFDAFERAEAVADNLHLKDLEADSMKKTSLKLAKRGLDGTKKKNVTVAKAKKTEAKRVQKEEAAYRAKVKFEAEMLKAHPVEKAESAKLPEVFPPKQKERIPRKQKKRIQDSAL